MTTREELLQRLWSHINSHVIPYYIGRALVHDDEWTSYDTSSIASQLIVTLRSGIGVGRTIGWHLID